MACSEQTSTSTKQNKFLAQLYKFHEQNGTPIKKIPVVGGEPVNMYRLYNQVEDMGGFSKVTKDKQWNEIAQLFYQKHDVLNAGYLLKQHYIRFLMKYELTMKGAMLARPIKSSNASPPIVTPLQNPKVSAPGGLPPIATVRPTTNATPRVLFNIGVVSTSTIHHNFDLNTTPVHYKLSMSLKSGLPNEVDFAFNALTILSSDENNPLLLSSVPSLLDLMLGHVGIYDEFDNGFKELYLTWSKVNSDLDYCQFWHSSVPHKVWSALLAVEHPGKFDEPQELFHSYCGIGESTVESYRVAQVANIIRNLSLEKDNIVALGENKQLLIFVVLCMNCCLPRVMRSGYEIAVNIASVLRISKGSENVCFHLFMDTVVSAVVSEDRMQVIRGMQILGELAWCIDNAELLAELPDEVYKRILFCTLVPDVEMLHCCFETLYSLSSLDQEVTDRIINIPNSIKILVQFLTFKSEPFEQNAINKMEIELLSSDTTKPASHHDAIAQGTSCATSGISSLMVSPAQPLTNYIPQTQPVVSLKVQPERPLPLTKPTTGDGNFVFKWLKSDYEEVRGGMLSRTDLMQDFQNFCARFGHTSGYTLMQLLRLVKMVFPSSYTRRIFDSNDVPQYVIGGVRKKLNVLQTTPVVFPNNSRQFSVVNDQRKIIPKSLNSENKIASSTGKGILSNIVTSKNSQATRSSLPAFIPTSISQNSFNFNKILSNQYKENMLSYSTKSKVSGFDAIPESVQSLTHNELFKAILPANNQIFTSTTPSELKSSQCIARTKNCSTHLSSTPLNANLLSLISCNNNMTSSANFQHQNHVSKNSSKVICYWEDCKRCCDTHKDLFIHCVTQHLHENVIKCKWQGCMFTANRARPSLLRHIEVFHCTVTGKRPDIPSTTSILMNLKAFPMIELEEESKLTKSIRLTASLILYNLLISSPRATRNLSQHEIELSVISLSGVDCAGIVAKCLFILHNHNS